MIEWFIKFWKRYFKNRPVIPNPVPPIPAKPIAKYMSLNAYDFAKAEIGVKEVEDGENPRIIEYHAATYLKASDDETPWCSSFMNWCMQKAGGQGTKNAMARSWLGWGKLISEPKEGDTVIFSSPMRGPQAGHVAFFVKDKGSMVEVLGGNQSNRVSITDYPKALVLGYRRSLDG